MGALKYSLAVLALAVGTSVLAGELGGGAAPSIPWGRIALAFLFCIALAAGAILLLRKYRGYAGGSPGFPPSFLLRQAGQRSIEILETRRVSPHGDVCLLRCKGQDYLFIVTPQQALLLDKSGEQAG
jgi:hypothetical protein